MTKSQLTQAVNPYPADNFSGASIMGPREGFSTGLGTTAPSGFKTLYSIGATVVNSEAQGSIQEFIKTGQAGMKDSSLASGGSPVSSLIDTSQVGEVFNFDITSNAGTGVFDASINVVYRDRLPAGLNVGALLRTGHLITANNTGGAVTFNTITVISSVGLVNTAGTVTPIGTLTSVFGTLTLGATDSLRRYNEVTATPVAVVSTLNDRIIVTHQITGDFNINPSLTTISLNFGSAGSYKSPSESVGCRPVEVSVS